MFTICPTPVSLGKRIWASPASSYEDLQNAPQVLHVTSTHLLDSCPTLMPLHTAQFVLCHHCPVQEGNWASIPCLLQQPTTQMKMWNGDSLCAAIEWLAARGGMEEKPKLLLELGSKL